MKIFIQKMDISTTYKIFLIKTLKEKHYYWARNIFFVLFPLLFFTTYIFSGATESSRNGDNGDSRTYPSISEVRTHSHSTPHPALRSKNSSKFIFLSRFTTSDLTFRKTFTQAFHRHWIIKFTLSPTQRFMLI